MNMEKKPKGYGSAASADAPGRTTDSFKKNRFGIKLKMMILFFVVPIFIVLCSSTFSLLQMNKLSLLVINESSDVVKDLAEQMIAKKAWAVAREIKLYLETHPELTKEQFQENADFVNTAVQKVGQTGYTAVYALPDDTGVWRTWAHANPKIIGIDMKNLESRLGESFAGFWKIYTGVTKTNKSEGYYTWKDKDGQLRDKFMVSVPIEGTQFAVASTTYINEFTQPIKKVEERGTAIKNSTIKLNIAILGFTIILIALIVYLYAKALTLRIQNLTNLTERISIGEMDAEIDERGNDELGELGGAIRRMQESIRMSLEMLQRRK